MNDFENEPLFIDNFNYELPDDRVAKYPLNQRDSSKLLLWKDGDISKDIFSNISNHLPTNSLLIRNNTRVIQARLIFHKESGAKIEVFCLEPHLPVNYELSFATTKECQWKCLIGNKRRWKNGEISLPLTIENRELTLTAELIEVTDNENIVKFHWNDSTISFSNILQSIGELPIPPYLHRKAEESDKTTYQTVYSKIDGSVAAPTAGLHFTDAVFQNFSNHKIELAEITLHVGAGTFKPVTTENVLNHSMHTEHIAVSLDVLKKIKKNLGNIVAVGTTSVRTLESIYWVGKALYEGKPNAQKISQWQPYFSDDKDNISSNTAIETVINYLITNNLKELIAETQIMIKPGYNFKLVNAIITNFHQPKSTLLLLISAFVGDNWKQIYDYALQHNFRFLSYGDSSLLTK